MSAPANFSKRRRKMKRRVSSVKVTGSRDDRHAMLW
jgi:hypothetical protein